MVTVKMSTYLVLLSFTFLLVSCSSQGHATQVVIPHLQKVSHSIPSQKELHLQGVGEEVSWKEKISRRLMIGSTAPICTYNECKGCKHKCRAEQIPVDANDPINSAYHYRCVCHR